WVVDSTLVSGRSPVDPTLFQHNGVWYMTEYNTTEQTVHLYYNTDTFRTDQWTRHPNSPIITGRHIRNGGRPMIHPDSVDLFIQEPSADGTIYGERVHIYRLSNLTPSSIIVSRSPKPVIEAQGTDLWHNAGMHHLDIIESSRGALPIAVADGVTTG